MAQIRKFNTGPFEPGILPDILPDILPQHPALDRHGVALQVGDRVRCFRDDIALEKDKLYTVSGFDTFGWMTLAEKKDFYAFSLYFEKVSNSVEYFTEEE